MLTRKRLRVTYSQAACLYFGVENTLENKRRCIEKLSPYHDSTLVYTDDPGDPLVMSNVKINCRAITYKKYLPDDPDAVEQVAEADADKDSINESEETTIGNTAKPSNWSSDAQILELVDTLFLPVDPNINEVYTKDCLSTKEILDIISSYLPDKHKEPAVFGRWCGRRNAAFMKVKDKAHKSKEPGRQQERKRELHVLDPKYHGNNNHRL